MNGTNGFLDPRLPIVASKGTSVNYVGEISGSSGSGGGNCNLATTTWHSTSAAPILMVTFSEQKFIEAEAQFIANGGTPTSKGTSQASFDAFKAAVKANMDKLGVNALQRDSFIMKVAPSKDSITLAKIMLEKHKALFLNPETWVDMRRYDYATTVYPNLTLPANVNPMFPIGQFIRRSLYPTSEIAYNNASVTPSIKKLWERLWWDQ
jgi:Starch-binding associating with outer membrane